MEHTDIHGAPTAPAGWYDDPGGSDQLRYWTGTTWSESLRAASHPPTDDRDDATGGDAGQLTVDPPADDPSHRSTIEPPSTHAERIAELLQTAAGLSLTQISRETGLARSETTAAIDELKRTGQVVETNERPPRYSLSQQARAVRSSSAPPLGPTAERIAPLLLSSRGMSLTQISRETGLARSETTAAIDELKRTGQVVETNERPPVYHHVDGAPVPPTVASAAAHPMPGAPSAGSATGGGPAGAPAPPVTFGAAVSKGIDRGLDFTGRATRPEYWWFALFVLLVGAAALILAVIPGIGPILAGLVWLAIGLAQLAVGVRRLHDTGRSGAWIFWLTIAPGLLQFLALPALGSEAYGLSMTLYFGGMLLGGVGSIVILVFLASPGDPQPNRFGPPPG